MTEGWKCPVCGRGVAPGEKSCDHGGGLTAPIYVPTPTRTWPLETSDPPPLGTGYTSTTTNGAAWADGSIFLSRAGYVKGGIHGSAIGGRNAEQANLAPIYRVVGRRHLGFANAKSSPSEQQFAAVDTAGMQVDSVAQPYEKRLNGRVLRHAHVELDSRRAAHVQLDRPVPSHYLAVGSGSEVAIA